MLKVDGMVCDGCSSRVEETLQKMAGAKKVRIASAHGRYILLLSLPPGPTALLTFAPPQPTPRFWPLPPT